MTKKIIQTLEAPSAIGIYSQAVSVGRTTYLSGQIPLLPETMEIVSPDPKEQILQVFKNLEAVCKAAGGSLRDLVKLTIYLTNLSDFPLVNETMAQLFSKPYPARVTIGVNALPKGVLVEIEGVMVVDPDLV